MPNHFYRVAWVVGAAVCGVLAFTYTALFVFAFAACIVGGLAVERGWDKRVAASLPVGFRWPVYRKVPKAKRPQAPLGALDFELKVKQASERYVVVMGRMGAEMIASADVMTKYVPRFKSVDNGTTEQKIAVSKAYAKEQARHVATMDKLERNIAREVAEVTANSIQRIKAFPAGADLSELRVITANLGESVKGGLAQLAGYRASLVTVRAANLQQASNEVTDRHLEVVDRIGADYGVMRTYVGQALAELDRRTAASSIRSARKRRA